MSRHGRAKQYGPEPPAAVYTKPPPPVHSNNTYNGRAHHHYQQQQSQQQQQQQQQHHQQLLQQQYYGVQQQQQQQLPNIVGSRPTSSNYHHHSLPRNAWSADIHSPAAGDSSSNSSNERAYTASRRAKHHRVYSSHRQARTLHKMAGGGGGCGTSGATTDPDALSSVTTAGVIKYNNQSQQHPSQQQLHQPSQHHRSNAHSAAWPSEPSSSSVTLHHHQLLQPAVSSSTAAAHQHLGPLLPPQNRQPHLAAAGLPTATATLRHHQQPSSAVPLLLPSCDVAVDACGGHCPRFENFCHFCLLIFYFSGITVGFLLIMAAIVSSRDPRFLYIGGLVLPVSAFLMAVQCRVRQDADRRKRHRLQLNGRHHQNRSNAAAAVMVCNGGSNVGQSSAETIPMHNIAMMAGAENTLRRQFQGNIYQYVGQRDEANSHHYETASDVQQIEGVPWWRREENRSYHGRAPPYL